MKVLLPPHLSDDYNRANHGLQTAMRIYHELLGRAFEQVAQPLSEVAQLAAQDVERLSNRAVLADGPRRPGTRDVQGIV